MRARDFGRVPSKWWLQLTPYSASVPALEEVERLAADAGVKALFCAPVWDVDDVHRAVALSGDEQFVAVERHVHRLITDLDGRLLPKRRIDQAYRVAVEAGDAKETVIRRVTGNLRRLRDVLERDLVAHTAGLGVDQEQRRLRVVDRNDGVAVGRDGDARERARRLDFAQQSSFRQVDDRNGAVFLVLGVKPTTVRRDDQSVAVGRA